MINLFGNVPKITHANKKEILNRQKHAGEKRKEKRKNKTHHIIPVITVIMAGFRVKARRIFLVE